MKLMCKRSWCNLGIVAVLWLAAGLAWFSPSLGCSWFQQTKPDLQCAALTSVDHAGELFVFIKACQGISDTYSAFTDCLRPVIASKWSQEVVDCFVNDALNGKVPPVVAREGGSVPVPDGGAQ